MITHFSIIAENIYALVQENTINQRLKFLIEKLSLSVRAFSELIGESSGNTNNYIGSRQLAPKHEYLAKVLLQFSNVNAHWLLTGQGEPFLSQASDGTTQTGNFNQIGSGNSQKVKGNKNNVQTANGDHNNITNNIKLDNCQRDLATAQKEIALLTSQLADKERTIQILLAHQEK